MTIVEITGRCCALDPSALAWRSGRLARIATPAGLPMARSPDLRGLTMVL